MNFVELAGPGCFVATWSRVVLPIQEQLVALQLPFYATARQAVWSELVWHNRNIVDSSLCDREIATYVNALGTVARAARA